MKEVDKSEEVMKTQNKTLRLALEFTPQSYLINISENLTKNFHFY